MRRKTTTRAEVIKLGTFEVDGPAATHALVALSDPCYKEPESVWAARKGTWTAFAVRREGRNVAIVAVHGNGRPPLSAQRRRRSGLLGVDSGQLGIFSLKQYQRDDSVPRDYLEGFPKGKRPYPYEGEEPWYCRCCAITLNEPGAGVFREGTVSATANGDGVYPYFCSVGEDKLLRAVHIRLD